MSEQLAEVLGADRPESRATAADRSPPMEARGDVQVTRRQCDISVHRLSDGGLPDTTWAGDWLILVVSKRRESNVHSMVSLTTVADRTWVRDGSAEMSDVVACLDVSDPGRSLEAAGWHAASITGRPLDDGLQGRANGLDDGSER